MATINYYAILGVTRDATDDEIKKAYRKLVFEFHPDRNPDDKEAEVKIREINAAYEVIGDPETRRTYERLRFGDDDVTEHPPDPAVILEAMEQKLYEEGQKEVFAILIKDVKRIKAELALVRERTVAQQGYDSFKKPIILDRASEIMEEWVTPDMEARRKRLLDVALQMMVSQRVIKKGEDRAIKEIKDRFEDTFRRGRLNGFLNALELFYVRR